MTGLGRLLRRLRTPSVWSDFPTQQEVDRARFDQDMGRSVPDIQFTMFFTPRSGSSWVADIVTRSRRMGHLGESFNPNFLPQMTRAMNVTSLAEYCDVLPRRRQGNGVFGFQITDHQMRTTFGSGTAFLDRFPSDRCVWLVRRDLVLQAVSLYKMQQTGLAHAPQASHGKIRRHEAEFRYDAREIKRWLRHILAAEAGTEALIAQAGLTPLRMSYERNTAMKSNHVVNVIARHIGVPTARMKTLHSPHEKIGTTINDDFAARFRRDHPGLVARAEDKRAAMLEKIVHYGPKQKPDAIAP